MDPADFAPHPRAGSDTIRDVVARITGSPVVDGVLQVVNGVVAVLNESRQILAVNHHMLEMLGIEQVEALVGLRPGEAIGCVHAGDGPDGCGTTAYCRTCGAAMAMAVSLADDCPVELRCVATVWRGGRQRDLVLGVRAVPVRIAQTRLIVLCLIDTTVDVRRSELERMFLHDINNLLQGMVGTADLIELQAADDGETLRLTRQLGDLARRMASEIHQQRVLLTTEYGDHRPAMQALAVERIVADLQKTVEHHSAARQRELAVDEPAAGLTVSGDPGLVHRVLLNMAVNACEETPPGGRVRIWVEATDDEVIIAVHNPGEIDPDIALRVFERHFSTKEEVGRGLGTYAMKLFGEQLLGGRVWFGTGPAGTTFRFALPRLAPAEAER
ncbi:MAG: sensor histidine kinase [Planctomycetota bacterium]